MIKKPITFTAENRSYEMQQLIQTIKIGSQYDKFVCSFTNSIKTLWILRPGYASPGRKKNFILMTFLPFTFIFVETSGWSRCYYKAIKFFCFLYLRGARGYTCLLKISIVTPPDVIIQASNKYKSRNIIAANCAFWKWPTIQN